MITRILNAAVCIAVAMACAFASWWSVRMARADWLAETGPPEALAQAARMEPDDARLRAANAIVRSDDGDFSAAADKDLREASQLNPYDSTVLMTLGLRAEFRGDPAAAERYLVQAADVDHQFKPAWTLANFYARTHQPQKIWPLLKRCLELDPLGFDTRPVFDLCWTYSDDANQILKLIPHRRPRLIEYFSYLVGTGRVDAAAQVWPAALQLSNPTDDAGALLPFPGLLVRTGRGPVAVTAWNQLVDKGVLPLQQLNPSAGLSIGDPAFTLPATEAVFSWHLAAAGGIFMRPLSPSLRIEFDGDEPENIVLLQTVAPVIRDRTYRMKWKTEPSRLSLPNDAGFIVRITGMGSQVPLLCSLLSTPSGCVFTASSEAIQVELVYTRAPGTTRAKGALDLLDGRLEFAS